MGRNLAQGIRIIIVILLASLLIFSILLFVQMRSQNSYSNKSNQFLQQIENNTAQISNNTAMMLNLWSDFQRIYDKNYSANEYPLRYNNFAKNHEFIEQFNSIENGIKLGINEFSDLTDEEFIQQFGSDYNFTTMSTIQPYTYDTGIIYFLAQDINQNIQMKQVKKSILKRKINYNLTTVLPESIDWRLEGAISQVQNQGACGSCYAFSTVSALEAAYYIKHQQSIQLSEQQIIDCSKSEGNMGCQGGNYYYTLEYLLQYGSQTAKSYQYQFGESNKGCQYSKSNVAVNIQAYNFIQPNNSKQLQNAVAQGPVMVTLCVEDFFKSLESGIIDFNQICCNQPNCCGRDIGHAVLIVGYDQFDDGYDKQYYWIIQNSWGPKWGDNGYFYIAFDNNEFQDPGICSINSYSFQPIVY